jgi:phosphate transport system permease protein
LWNTPLARGVLLKKRLEMIKKAKITGDLLFKGAVNSSVVILALLVVGIFVSLLIYSYPTIIKFGFGFITGTTWDPVMGEFGALPFLIGTLLTSFIALIISFPVSLTISILLSEYLKSGVIYNYFKSSVELLAGIPSIIYGFWGLFILVPVIREFEMAFDIDPYGVGIMTSSLILALMIIPYSASIAYEVIALTPNDIKEAAYSLGATKFEVIRKIIIPYSSSGIIAGILLSLGRALGETMAVTMVIGNSNMMPTGLFAPGNTMASVIANEFTEATSDVYLSALIEIGLLLMIVTGIINLTGKYIIKKLSVSKI